MFNGILKKLFLCSGLASAVIFDGYAQVANPSFQPDMLPHSPEAEQMTKYTTTPVTLYSGLPNISIPIYEFKTQSLDIPISLGYNYNGFKPAEVAGYAGLGWSVQGGGVITRMVKSRVDHEDVHVTGNDYDNYTNIALMTAKQEILQNTALNLMDGEPDIYVFNCNGMSGKFILLQGQAYMLPYQPIRVMGSPNGGFTLTNDKGDQYVFKATERSHHHQLFGTDYVPDHYSAWYLSTVISADKVDTISYSYSSYTFQQPPVYSETYTYETPNTAGLALNNPQTMTETASNGDNVQSLLLSSISYRDITVSFSLDPTPRRDIDFNDGSLSRLSGISIRDSRTSNYMKSFTLQHAYYNGKLSLMQVYSNALPVDGNPFDSSTVQKWKFQYNGDTTSTTIPGFSTRSIDKFGYYNGAQNVMLFTTEDLQNSTYIYANRTPNINYSKLGMMTQMSYPTGGYTTFDYEVNQVGHYIVTGQYHNDYDTISVNPIWPGNDPNFVGPDSLGGTFTINDDQLPNVVASWSPSDGNINTTEAIIRITTMAGAPVNTILCDGSRSSLSTFPELTAGTYHFEVIANKKGVAVIGTIIYYNKLPIIDNTLGPAPGLRVKTISHYDNPTATSPALVKQYSYSDGVGLFTPGTKSHTMILHAECPPPNNDKIDSAITTLQAGLYAPSSELLNNQFYYKYVEETDVGPQNIGKKVYTYNCFGADEPDVYQTSETDYGYGKGMYYPLHKTANVYQVHDKYYFATYTAYLSDKQYPGYYCLPMPTPDPTQDTTSLGLIYSAEHGMLVGGYKTLQSTSDTTWDMNGANPMVVESDYFYDNPSYIYPTRIKKNNSKGQIETTYMKYALDYPAPGGSTVAGYDSAWFTLENAPIATYNSCYNSLLTALGPYQPYYDGDTAFKRIVHSYHCESDYQTNSGTAYTNRNNTWAAYLAGLTAAKYSDPIAWRKAVYQLENMNAVSTVIEQHKTVKLADSNEYLVEAVRNDFSLMTDVAGDTVAKPTQIETTELGAPLLYSTFAANTSAYYLPQIYMSYDKNMSMVWQNRNHDVQYNYLWGYNHRFPVAMVEGSDSATIAGLVNQSVLDNPVSDAALRTELDKIRTGLANVKALVTTVTYDPLIGITSKTDPAGKTSYFEYDGIGRLTDIKDLNGNIIKTFQYHFTSQP